MKKIGIMGGTFNPVHNAHLAIAQCACKEYGLDGVMFLPNCIPPHKKSSGTVDTEFRVEMVKAAIENNNKFFISLYEIEKGGISYTVDTLKHFSEIYENIYFIIGGDSIRDFPKWYKPDEISKLCSFIAYPRNGLDFEEHTKIMKTEYGAKVFRLTAPEIDISSSGIRELIKKGEPFSHLVPEKVYKIIKENKLYE